MTTSDDTAQHLATVVTGVLAGPTDLVYGQNCRPGPMRPASDNQALTGAIPNECIFILDQSGLIDIAYKADPTSTVWHEWPRTERYTLLILVRGNPRAYDETNALAALVTKALDKNAPTGYFRGRVIDGRPSYLQEDDEGRSLWSITYELFAYRTA